VSPFADRVELLIFAHVSWIDSSVTYYSSCWAIDLHFLHQVLSLANSGDNPSETPHVHLEDRTILTQTDTVEGLTRERTHSTCLIGGGQTVQHYHDSLTCCVQYWPTHTALVHLSIPSASSMRLPMTIRSRHTPTTLNYPCRPSLTNDPCGPRVSR
jgi:hypothetical protein